MDPFQRYPPLGCLLFTVGPSSGTEECAEALLKVHQAVCSGIGQQWKYQEHSYRGASRDDQAGQCEGTQHSEGCVAASPTVSENLL